MFPSLRHRVEAALDAVVEFSTLGEYRLGPDLRPAPSRLVLAVDAPAAGLVLAAEPPAPVPLPARRLGARQAAPQRSARRASSCLNQSIGSLFLPSVEPSSSTKRRNSAGSGMRANNLSSAGSSGTPWWRRRQIE